MPSSYRSSGLILLLLCFMSSMVSASELYFVDAHSQVDEDMNLEQIITQMNKAGVQRTILAARGRRATGDVVHWANSYPDRIVASMRIKGGAYMYDRPKYYQNLNRRGRSDKFDAMAELLIYHAQKGGVAPEVIVHLDDNRVLAALKVAKEQGWPLILHIEFASLSRKDKTIFYSELEALLREHPQHPFAINHMGQLSAVEVETLIDHHPNIYFLAAHSNTIAVERSRQPWIDMFRGDALVEDWYRLVVKHPDRFIFAIDNVFKEHWYNDYAEQVALWRKALAKLPDDIAHAIAHGNAERLWSLELP